MIRSFTVSETCTVKSPRSIQRRLPLTFVPMPGTSTSTSATSDAMRSHGP